MVGSYPSLALHYAKDMFEWKAQVQNCFYDVKQFERLGKFY